MSKTKDENKAKQSRIKLGVLMKLLDVKTHEELSQELEMSPANISRVASGQLNISDRIFLRAAILLDMKPSELMEKLDINQDYFFEYYGKNRQYEQKAA